MLIQAYIPPSDKLESSILDGMKDTKENEGKLFVSKWYLACFFEVFAWVKKALIN